MEREDTPTPGRWLMLIHQLPPKPNYLRVKVGRRLARIGAVALKNTVYVLPTSDAAQEDFQWVRREITAAGGEATLLSAVLVDGLTDAEVEALFRDARDVDYAAVASEARALEQRLSSGPVEEDVRPLIAADLARLERRMTEIGLIDFFSAPGSESARNLLAGLSARMKQASPDATPSTAPSDDDLRGRTWVTRASVGIDRIASAWLIRRFIDPTAEVERPAERPGERDDAPGPGGAPPDERGHARGHRTGMSLHVRWSSLGSLATMWLLVGCGSGSAAGGSAAGSGGGGAGGASSASSSTGGAGGQGGGASVGVPWARLVGKQGAAEAQGIAVDGSDNVYVVGQFKEIVDCGGGSLYASGYRDIFVAKYTSTGQHVWSKRFGSLLGDTLYGHVAAGPEGDLYLALNLLGPVDFGVGPQGAPGGGIVVKLDPNGAFVWSDAPSRRSLTPLPGGELLTSSIEESGCPDDASLGSWADTQRACVVLERRNAEGALTWQKRYPGFVDQPLYTTGNTVRPAARDGAGNILLGGNLAGGLNFGAPMTVPGLYETDVYAAVVDASGPPVWSRHIAPGPELFPTLVLPADTADLLLLGVEYDEFAGPFDLGVGPMGQTGTRDSWLARFDSAGNTQWARAFVPIDGTQPPGNAALIDLRGLVQRAPNDYVGLGAMTASADLGAGILPIFDRSDIFVLTLDGAGTTTSSRVIPGADTQDVVGAAALSNGLVAVSGITLGSVDFGQGALVPQVYWDTYVAVIEP